MGVVFGLNSTPGAPALTGEAGSAAAVLDYWLVLAGWTIAYSGTDTRAYRQAVAPDAALRAYLWIDDAGPGTHGAREAQMRLYEQMSDVDTGVRPCPTVAQLSSGLILRKSATLNTDQRPYLFVGDARTFGLFVAPGDDGATYTHVGGGDYYSFVRPSDPYRQYLQGRHVEGSAVSSYVTDTADLFVASLAGVLPGLFYLRDIAGNPGAIRGGMMGDLAAQDPLAGVSTYNYMQGILSYKNVADQYIYSPPVTMTQTVGGYARRGLHRYLAHFCHPVNNATDRALFSGAAGGNLAGRDFIVVKPGAENGVWAVEYSDTWRTNT